MDRDGRVSCRIERESALSEMTPFADKGLPFKRKATTCRSI